MSSHAESQKIYDRAGKLMPGGVSSPIRAFGATAEAPIAIERGEGPFIWDADGNKYIDYVLSWGPLIYGHADPDIVAAIQKQAQLGTGFGAVTKLEVELAELISQAMPVIENIRFVNSGTEATMSAIRLARGYTGRDKIIKFKGGYHGHSDSLLVAAKTGITLPDGRVSAGIPSGTTADTLAASYNDLHSVEKILRKNEVVGIIVEPIAANMGLVLPKKGFLSGLRELADKYGAVLIFDEVLIGFRTVRGGTPFLYEVTPDLVTLGKVIGGGLPVGAYGGKKEIMNHVAPKGDVFQGGSQAGNALGMAAGIAQLRKLQDPYIYGKLINATEQLTLGIKWAAQEAGIPIVTHSAGSMFGLSFQSEDAHDYKTALKTNVNLFKRWHSGMLERGIYLAPGPLEVGFVSASHAPEQIEKTVEAAREVLTELAR